MSAFEKWTGMAHQAGREHEMGRAVGYCINALKALAAERAEARRAQTAKALDELARVDAPLISEPPVRLCVRQLEPRSVEPRHWGMF